LTERAKEQASLLDRATLLVKPGGRIAYVTCSVLAEENGDQVQAFLARHPEFFPVAAEEVASALGTRAAAFLAALWVSREDLLMTPRRTGTDGFYIALLRCNR
ncbi:MAG: MFS transporter, partial [Rhodoplanes sp.]